MEMREVTLPSGKSLRINPAPFAEAQELYFAFLEEMKTVNLDTVSVSELVKLAACNSFTSKRFQAALGKCLLRSLYEGVKVTPEVFEPIEARHDYAEIMYEVAYENLAPFMKGLYARYSVTLARMTKSPA